MCSDKHLRVHLPVNYCICFSFYKGLGFSPMYTLEAVNESMDLRSQSQVQLRAEDLILIGKICCLIMKKIGQMAQYSRTNYLHFYQ